MDDCDRTIEKLLTPRGPSDYERCNFWFAQQGNTGCVTIEVGKSDLVTGRLADVLVAKRVQLDDRWWGWAVDTDLGPGGNEAILESPTAEVEGASDGESVMGMVAAFLQRHINDHVCTRARRDVACDDCYTGIPKGATVNAFSYWESESDRVETVYRCRVCEALDAFNFQEDVYPEERLPLIEYLREFSIRGVWEDAALVLQTVTGLAEVVPPDDPDSYVLAAWQALCAKGTEP